MLPGVMRFAAKRFWQVSLRMFSGALILVPVCTGCWKRSPEAPDAARPPAAQSALGNASPARGAAKARLPHQLERSTTPAPARSDDWFEDRASAAGVAFAYRDGSEAGFYQLLETVGGGVALFDYDGDGATDLFFTGGGRLTGPPLKTHGAPGGLFRNRDSWRFDDITAPAGLRDDSLYTHGCSVGDFNSDGFPDLFVAGFHGVRLFCNQGDGSFEEVAAQAGLNCPHWNVTGAWADLDRDGDLDLYVVTYADFPLDDQQVCLNDQQLRDVCGPTLFPGRRDQIWRNEADCRFREITDEAGLVPANRGLGVVAADIDENGWIDFYVVNDVEENQLYLNDGRLPFRSEAGLAGVAFSPSGEREGSMGVDVGDFNNDGLPDLWYTNYANQDNSLMQNVGDGGFIPAAPVTGMLAVSRPWVGFGTGFADFDGDGWQDLFVANGHVLYDARDGDYFQPPQLFHNRQGKRFAEITARGGPYFSVRRAGRGAATGDLDQDGAVDLVIVHQNENAALLRNRQSVPHWAGVRLIGRDSNRDAVGAKIQAHYGEQTLSYWMRGGGGYASHFDPRVVIPQPDAGAASLRVQWPSGRREVFSDLQQGQTHELLEGLGRSD